MIAIIVSGLCALLNIIFTVSAMKAAEECEDGFDYCFVSIILTIISIALFIANVIKHIA